MQYPTTGGSWSRDPVTGELTRIDKPANSIAPATANETEAEETTGEPAKPTGPKGRK